jgi:hypothetical protein
MYLKTCLYENIGPIEFLDFDFPFNENGTPKPLVLVGENGSGKSIFLSYIADALIEFSKVAFDDTVKGMRVGNSPYFRLINPNNQKMHTKFGICLLEFFDESKSFSYVEKTGSLKQSEYFGKIRNRFNGITFTEKGNVKEVSNCNSDIMDPIFKRSSICFFPSTRRESPHWLNIPSVYDYCSFNLGNEITGKLGKPIFMESNAEETKKWLLDLFLDSMIAVDFGAQIFPSEDPRAILNDKNLLTQGRQNIDTLLRHILQNPSVRLKVNYRTQRQYRLCVADKERILLPSLDNLSLGQSILFNLFATVIRYAEKWDINKCFKLNEIEGVVLIDEVDAHLHSNLQVDVLPTLIKLFPKIQFILTTHSPLFLLGMENAFSEDGFLIFEMPYGRKISTERFSEFGKSFEYYKTTKAFEDELVMKLEEDTISEVLVEGETDLLYIKTALQLLGRDDLLQKISVKWVGANNEQGSFNTGCKGLDNYRKVMEAKPELIKGKKLLLYDCDVYKSRAVIGNVEIVSIPHNSQNPTFKKGIENLLPSRNVLESVYTGGKDAFGKRFYPRGDRTNDYGAKNEYEKFDKTEFCKWICEERKDISDFQKFGCIIELLEVFVAPSSTEEPTKG